MARKVSRPRAKKSASTPGADDLQVLHPNQTVTIAGRTITVREYGFIEGLGLRPLVQPLLDALHESLAAGQTPDLEHIILTLARNATALRELIAVAADVEPEWIDGLNQSDGHLLLMLWWTANGPFYVRCVFDRLAAQAAEARARAGQMSTQSSSVEDTAPPMPSGA